MSMNNRQLQPFVSSSAAIRQEIQRFESVHPSIYAIYDIIELIPDPLLAQQIREHVVCIEDSFVNSQEWTLSRSVPDLRLGIVGSLSSGKSALVHRYLTGSYMQEESPEGGRFKKEIVIDGNSYLLLIRDEGGPPELQFTAWVDAVIFVFSLESEASFNAIYSYYAKMAHYRSTTDVPLILVGTQDAISENNPRIIDDSRARKLAADLKRCSYYETCATYGLNVDRVFQDACTKIVNQRSTPLITPTNSRPSTPTHLLRYPPLSNNGYTTYNPAPYPPYNPSYTASNPYATPHLQQNSSPSHPYGSSLNKEGSLRSGSIGSTNPTVGGANSVVAELNAMTRTESFRDDAFKRVSAPSSVFMPPPPPPASLTSTTSATLPHPSSHSTTTTAAATISGGGGGCSTPTMTNSSLKYNSDHHYTMHQPSMGIITTPGHMMDGNIKDLPTPSSTPTTSRKSRRKSNLFTPSKKTEDKDKSKNGEVGSGRAIPIKQGYLYKKSNKTLNKDWKKKYVTLCDNGRLTYHSSLHDYMEDSHGKDISLQCTTVKVPGMKPRGSRVVGAAPPEAVTSELDALHLASAPASTTNSSSSVNSGVSSTTPGRGSIGGIAITKDKVTLTSYEPLQDANLHNGGDSASLSSKIETPNVKKRHRRMKSSGAKTTGDLDDAEGFEFSIVSLDNKQWLFEASSQEEREEWVTAIEQQILASLQGNESHKKNNESGRDPQAVHIIKTRVPGNNLCADCDAPNPEWASINLGMLVCIECSGIHRNLGSHISKVRSLDLDDWPCGPASVLQALGNEAGNRVWESNVHNTSLSKPGPRSPREDKERWIRAKYEAREFLQLLPSTSDLSEDLVESVCCGDVARLSLLLQHTNDVNKPIAAPRDTRTLLHLAAGLPSLPALQLLIWHNANVQALDSDGRSALYYARAAGDRSCIELLLQSGCPETCIAASTSQQQQQSSTLPRRKSSFSRKPEILDKLQASII
ncbi:centaurin-gamma-1A isoform X2 [Hyalella azteca]|uniref:Centaurin-gamma-1A isoform X2 n=1 Tax=Hyalella azteca TaxID=294128 RepID=A0A8B7NN85_HYAAZ|nr:centaurin-gamma-1A isoform X2 [Hyalella azteca]